MHMGCHMTNLLDYAVDDQEAQKRYEQYKSIDPFSKIEAALLNSADIADYVSMTGMIYPFDPERLKSASYEMTIGGEVLCWDEYDKEEYYVPLVDQEIKLRRNSITFVTVDAKFRLPDYIAMRFNLQIEHVHKGILLGTGPLINPGFCGKLMIPMHNLTNNDYIIKCGAPLIGVEFTKLSYNKSWGLEEINKERKGEFIKNKGKKSDKTFHDYISMFIPRGMIVKSSLSGAIDKAERSARKAERFIQKITTFSVIALAVLIIGLFALAYQVYDIVSSANSNVTSANQKLSDVLRDNEKMKEDYKNLSNRIEKLKKEQNIRNTK